MKKTPSKPRHRGGASAKKSSKPAAKRQASPRATGRKALDTSMRRLRASVARTVSQADVVLEAADAIAQLAVTRAKSKMIRALLEDEVLSSIHAASQEGESSAIGVAAFTRWLKEHLGIEPLYVPGQVMTIQDGKLSAFHLRNPIDKSAGPLHRVAIVAAGWKQGTKMLRPPVADFVRADQ
ncbi:MAG: hypothetical protein AB7K09_18395 [Planctomycetota bacterium]